MNYPKQLVVIVVFYNPSEEQIDTFVRLSKSFTVVAVDNSNVKSNINSGREFIYLPLLANRGIAAAQNIGIRMAETLEAKYIVFFDQDSAASDELVKSLICEYCRIKGLCPNVATVGPRIINKDTGKPYKICGIDSGKDYAMVQTLISSGSVVELSTFQQVGFMKEELFIDMVDTEWCWRAYSKGFVCCISNRAKLLHKVAQKERHLFGFPVLIAAPMRYYYIYRNFIILCSYRYVPLQNKIKTLIRRIIEPFFLLWVVKDRKSIFVNIAKGLRDGIKQVYCGR